MDIIKPLHKRYGFQTRGMQALGYLLKPFFHCKCEVPDELVQGQSPVVFVCNHYEVFGPIAVVLSLPLKYRLWINSIVAEPMENVEKMIIGTQHIFPFLSDNAARKLLNGIAPLLERVLSRFRSIAVHREHLGKQRHAIEKTVDAMLEGDNIVLFPETGVPTYSHGRVTEFYRSFVLIGEYYRRRTGKGALFCPVYVDKKHRMLRFGQLVKYGEEKAAAECERITQELRGQLLAMAEEALGSVGRLTEGA